jgi:hypothetical protein
MFRITSEKELRECFRDLDQPELILTTDLKFPLVRKDYLTWIEPSGCRTYLVFQAAGFKTPFGLVFRRDQTLGPSTAAMCEWCHCVRSGNEVGVLTATSHARKRVGISLCRDLSCAEKMRSAPGVHDFPSTASIQERIRKLSEKMALFARRELI